jgi:metallo-beta-lactamase class B
MQMKNRLSFAIAAFASIATASVAASQPADWTQPYPPFRIADNLYYVGSKGLASYLITTPQGHILINSNLESSVPQIQAAVTQLGFKFGDVKILLISHAHWDHNAGSARVKELTGASYMVMEGDADVVESGGKTDFQYGNDPGTLYPATPVERVLRDGDQVKLGDVVLTAHHTPGHTKGCTTWSVGVRVAGKMQNAVIICSPNVNPGYRLVDNARYPTIARDYERMFRVLGSLRCDVFLGAHGVYYDLDAKYARLKTGAADAFVDPAGCAAFVRQKEQEFRSALAKQVSG